MPLVSVIIPNWNGAHLLPPCLDSLRAQTLHDIEIIVSDDGSTDSSADLLAARYPEVILLRSERNRGFCQAANAGLEASRGEFIALVNNDTEADPRFLEELVRAMQSDTTIGLCAPKMIYYDDPSRINSAGHACGPNGVVVDLGRGQPDDEWFDQPREVLGASGGAALYRKQMLDEIGIFDPVFVTSVEDVDLDWRAQWAGWRAQYVPTAMIKHREGVSREIDSHRAVFLGLRNTAFVWIKNWPSSSLARHLPRLWRGLCADSFSLIRRGYGMVLPSVFFSLLLHLPKLLVRRKRIHRRVTAQRFKELLSLGEEQLARFSESQ